MIKITWLCHHCVDSAHLFILLCGLTLSLKEICFEFKVKSNTFCFKRLISFQIMNWMIWLLLVKQILQRRWCRIWEYKQKRTEFLKRFIQKTGNMKCMRKTLPLYMSISKVQLLWNFKSLELWQSKLKFWFVIFQDTLSIFFTGLTLFLRWEESLDCAWDLVWCLDLKSSIGCSYVAQEFVKFKVLLVPFCFN